MMIVITEILLLIAVIIFLFSFIYPEFMEKRTEQNASK
jgi:hypothetical protein